MNSVLEMHWFCSRNTEACWFNCYDLHSLPTNDFTQGWCDLVSRLLIKGDNYRLSDVQAS
ncbi:unnamed protein product [Urochloa humidicola]